MLEVKLFGTGCMSYCGRILPGFPNHQSYWVLCYLILNRQYPQCREKLASVFWDNYPTAVSKKYLRNAIWRLRQSLQSIGVPVEDYIFISEDTLSFVTSGQCWLDTEAFESTIGEYRDVSGQELNPQQAQAMETATGLFVGDLLEGIYEDWCLLDRERLSLLYMNALSKLMVFHECKGAYERGLACGERILARDHTRETVHRQMMQLYWRMGDRNAALAQYKRCAQILREELGISPMENTKRLYEQMVHNTLDLPSSGIPADAAWAGAPLADDSLSPLSEYVISRLKRLESATERNKRELEQIRHLLAETLSRVQRSEPDSFRSAHWRPIRRPR